MRSDTSSAQRSSVEAQASKRCACWQATAGLLSRNAMCTQLGANSRAQSRSLRATRGKRRSAHPQPLIITIEYSEFVGARGFVSLAPQLAASRAIRPVSCGLVISARDAALPDATGNHSAFGNGVVTSHRRPLWKKPARKGGFIRSVAQPRFNTLMPSAVAKQLVLRRNIREI